jgi:hypothetical protein
MATPGDPVPISDRVVVVSQIFFGVTIPLLVLASATLGFRLSRIRSLANIWSDGCITAGYILTVAAWGLFNPHAFVTPGPKEPAMLTEAQKGAFLSIPIWGIAMALIKASVGLTLVRIQSDAWFKIFIWTNIALAAAYGFGNMWFILFSCQPLSAAWGIFADPQSVKCLPPGDIRIAALIGAVVTVVTDVLLSLAPISFLWNLKRPLRERIVLGCLMALGLLAGASSIVKNIIIADFGKPGLDMLAMNISISTWTALEMLLGVIAACTPFCRPVLERCLSAVGLTVTNTSKPVTGGAEYERATEGDTFRSRQMATMKKNQSQYESDEDPVAPGIELQAHEAGIRKHTDISVHSARPEDEGLPREREYYLDV